MEGPGAARLALATWLGVDPGALRDLPDGAIEALVRLTATVPRPGADERRGASAARAAPGDRDREGMGRDLAAEERDIAADRRDRRADEHTRLAEGIDRTADRRAATDRQTAKDLRSSAAWGRAEAAEQREQAARGVSGEGGTAGTARDAAAELLDREAAADDDAADRSDRALELGAAGRRARAESARAETESDRTQASMDRRIAAGDRLQAARDRATSGTDELTGAHRRGAGMAAIQAEIDRARRTGLGCVAAYVDVDGLKAANDALGHAAGDALIVAVVDSLRASLRSYDVITRVGGDEFVCVLPDISLTITRERFEAASASLAAAIPGSSITVGFAEFQPGDTADDLVQRADGALLRTRGRR
jgi:diguanylate cyclase (GGDEF)-like protein